MEVVPPAPPIDAEMAEDAEAMMASQAAGGAIDSMEYDEEAPRYDEAGDVEINDAHQEHDDARSTEMGEEDARDYATLANAAALQQEFAASSSSMAAAAPMDGALVEAPMLPVVSSDGMQASQVVDDEHLETEAGYEPVEADAPLEQQGAQIVEVVHDADAEPVAQPQPGQAGDTAQGEAVTEPSAVNVNADENSTSPALAAATSTSSEQQHDEAQAASAQEHDGSSNEDEQANGEASAAATEQQVTTSEASHDHVAESSTAASQHAADAPPAKEGNNDSTAAHNIASTSSSTSPSTSPPAPLRLTFEEESFVLFPSSSESSQYLAYPSDGTDGPIQSVDAIPLSVPTEVYWEPLQALFKGLRVKEALGEFLEGGAGAGAAAGAGKEGATAAAAATGSVASDLVLRLPDLGLVVREDSVYTREVRLVDLVRLHEGLGAQSSLHIEVSEDDSFLHELRGLQEHVKESENAGALGQESHDDEEGVETGEATLDGQVEEVAAAHAQGDAQQEEAGVDAAEQTFVTVGEGHEEDDQDDDSAEQPAAGEDDCDEVQDLAGQAEVQHMGEDNDDDDADAQAEAEAEAEAEEPSYEPVEDGEAEVEADDAAEEQAEGEEKLVEYEEEEEGAADGEEDEQHEEGAEQYEEEGANDDDGEEENGEEQQDEEGEYPEEVADAEEVEEGYDEEEEAVDGHDEDDAAESAAAGEEEINGNGNASEAPARLGKRSFVGEDELDGDDNDAPHGESGVEAKKVKASH